MKSEEESESGIEWRNEGKGRRIKTNAEKMKSERTKNRGANGLIDRLINFLLQKMQQMRSEVHAIPTPDQYTFAGSTKKVEEYNTKI